MSKIKQRSIGFTERQEEMIREIMKAKGYGTLASVVQQAVIEMHGNVFKDYVMAKRARLEGTDGRSKDEVKKSLQTDKLTNICNSLDGELKEKNGEMYCHYFTYDKKHRYEQTVPLSILSEVLISKQYFPNKEYVGNLQKLKKTSYGTKNISG